jgi:hypothetical protein
MRTDSHQRQAIAPNDLHPKPQQGRLHGRVEVPTSLRREDTLQDIGTHARTPWPGTGGRLTGGANLDLPDKREVHAGKHFTDGGIVRRFTIGRLKPQR